jgi:hypothetical protein
LAQAAIISDADGTGALDRAHLSRMTFGDRALAREVVDLFDRQAGILLARMAGADGPARAALAHTLTGSAAGIGAFGVARAAAAIEQAAPGSAAEAAHMLDALRTEVALAQAAIREILRTSDGGIPDVQRKDSVSGGMTI